MEGNNYEEQYDEIQALESIFTEDFTLLEEKPYKFEININSNQESQEKNYLKLKMIVDLPDNYP